MGHLEKKQSVMMDFIKQEPNIERVLPRILNILKDQVDDLFELEDQLNIKNEKPIRRLFKFECQSESHTALINLYCISFKTITPKSMSVQWGFFKQVELKMDNSNLITLVANVKMNIVSDARILTCTHGATAKMTDNETAFKEVTKMGHLESQHRVFLELLETEENYIKHIYLIITTYKHALEIVCNTEEEILNMTEIKYIFKQMPRIYETHCMLLEDLKSAASHCGEDIGEIFLKYAPDLVKSYGPWIIYFENIKKTFCELKQSRPRFSDFLNNCQKKPECGKKSLEDLFICAVQRLQNLSFLLTRLHNYSPETGKDYNAIKSALNTIRNVVTQIDEEKNRIDGIVNIFDIFNDIKNCPPQLISSNRKFIARCDLKELSDSLSGRGDHFTFFLFSDVLEVCKKRSKSIYQMKSRNSIRGKSSKRPTYKHHLLIRLSTIKRVIDIKETGDCKIFALKCTINQEEKFYSFKITNEETDKLVFLKSLCRQMANTSGRDDADSFLTSLNSEELDEQLTSDVQLSTFQKTFKFASRITMRVRRIFCCSKRLNRFERATSPKMSQFGISSNVALLPIGSDEVGVM